MKIATISSKNQITLPADILKRIKLTQGQKLIVQEQEEDKMFKIILTPVPKNLTDYFIGCGKKTFKALGGGEKFLKQLRKEWE